MLQVAITGGKVQVVEAPPPVLRAGGLLVRTSHSLISVGTETASAGGGESLALKALRHPELVRKVLDRVGTHGLGPTIDLVRSRLSSDQPIGYSCAGTVLEAAPDAEAFRPGDRVACCGTGFANHAAVNFVPRNLATRLPDAVSFEEGAFGTVAAIALQGVRRCAPALGDRVVVLGLGLLGQLTVQLLRASGAAAIGVDIRRERVERALSLGLEDGFSSLDRDLVEGILERTDERGADAVIVTAAGSDAELLNRAFEVCRRKGRVILVGDVPIRIRRDRIYRKEIDFLISTSYGPGRYDPEYEERGRDYPFAYVRWTEGRNLTEAVRLIGCGALRVRPLIDAVHPIEGALEAYESLTSESRPIGVLLDYHLASDVGFERRTLSPPLRQRDPKTSDTVSVGVIGYGSYFRSVLFPLLKAHSGFRLTMLCTRNGLTVRRAVADGEFAQGTTDAAELLADPDIQAVYIATRHDQHYRLARAAVEAGKAVFVEKPMTLTAAEGETLVRLVAERKALLTVGFNRRFSPHARRLRELLDAVADTRTLVYRVNAGPLPPEHWLRDPVEGGGRLLGEAVHFFDFLRFLAGSEAVSVSAISPRGRERDEASVVLGFSSGSVGTVVYTGGGRSESGKERVEVFSGGCTFVLDDFRTLEVWGSQRQKGLRTRAVEKGQREQLENFWRALRGEEDLGVTAEDGYRATWCAENCQRLAGSGTSKP